MIIPSSVSSYDKNEPKEPVVKDDNSEEDKVWPLLENRYGLNSMSMPSAKETDETSGCKYLLNDTPEPMNYQETDLDGRLEKHTTCTII